MEFGKKFEGLELPALPKRLLIGVLVGACYLAGAEYSPDTPPPSATSVPGFELVPSPETTRFLKKLPLVSESELPEFISEEKKKLNEFVDPLEEADGTEISEDKDLSWIANVSLGNGWEVNVSPNPGLIDKYDGDPNTEFVMASSNMLDSYKDSDGLFITLGGDGPALSSAKKKHSWNVIPQFEENEKVSKINSAGYESTDNGPMADSHNVLRLSIITTRKYYFKPETSLSGEQEDPELTYSNETIAKANVQYRLPWYKGQEQQDGIISRDDSDAVVSERPLSTDEYNEFFDKALFYRKYMKIRKPIVMIPVHGIGGGATSDQFKDLIIMPRKESQKETTLDHEFGHALLFEARDAESDSKEITGKLDELFDSITKSINGDYSYEIGDPRFNPCKPEYARIFEIFDETTYENIGCETGHPADSEDELFASAFAIMRFYPDKLLKNLDKLSGEKKQQAQAVINQVIDITDALAERANQPPIFSEDSELRKANYLDFSEINPF